ncbi:MAG TPA: hypothetical protein VFC25_00210 [Verrucomicrobiae bacterium]|nr:hypothetical protein [Verrucomicrobiae bacterium]
MTQASAWRVLLGLALLGMVPAGREAAEARTDVRTVALDSIAGLALHGVRAEAVSHRGRQAVRLVEDPASPATEPVALIEGSDFGDGTIELDVAGAPAAGAPSDARGFIGVAFRSVADGTGFESFYLRPTNGRADDQLRRNHATQYFSAPDYPWYRLRKETPGVYESYTDLETGAWTRLRIEVEGVKARLYVNDAPQPCLVVNDLKRGASRGLIGLWIGNGTEGWFSRLSVRVSPPREPAAR